MIPVATGVRIWIATGHTDMRKGSTHTTKTRLIDACARARRSL
jgi:transposase